MQEKTEKEKFLALTGPEKLGKGPAGLYDLRNRQKQAKDKVYQIGGQDLVTKVYPTDVIPETNNATRKYEYRPNNFLYGKAEFQQSQMSNPHRSQLGKTY